MVTCAVRSDESSRYCRVSAEAYALQPAIPSAGGSFTSRSPPRLRGGYRNLNRFHIGCASRPPLSPRLTLIRLTLFRNPWACGAGVSTPVVVTHAYIFVSGRSSAARAPPSAPSGMLPYRSAHKAEPRASAAVLMPGHHPRVAARLVSCYALFE